MKSQACLLILEWRSVKWWKIPFHFHLSHSCILQIPPQKAWHWLWTEHVDRCYIALTRDAENKKYKKFFFFFLRHRRPVAVPKGILDLCKLFMQIYGILPLFRDITAVTAIVQVRKWRKTCREIILDRMIQLEKRSVFLSSIGLSQVCNKAVISKTGYRLWNL